MQAALTHASSEPSPEAWGAAASLRARGPRYDVTAPSPIELHPDSPARAWVVVRQPKVEPDRMDFDPATRCFAPTGEPSLLHQRGFDGVAGWLVGLGEPPGEHLRALVLTTADPGPGVRLEVGVHGLVGDEKGRPAILGIDLRHIPCHGAVDLEALPRPLSWMLEALSQTAAPALDWRGGPAARAYLDEAARRRRARLEGRLRWPEPEAWDPPDTELAPFGPPGRWLW